jgi:hypothetical protein
MRLEKLRQVDLNLLIIFAVIAEEKSVTGAAARLPALIEGLQRENSIGPRKRVFVTNSRIVLYDFRVVWQSPRSSKLL